MRSAQYRADVVAIADAHDAEGVKAASDKGAAIAVERKLTAAEAAALADGAVAEIRTRKLARERGTL